jgi:hypothetical protein
MHPQIKYILVLQVFSANLYIFCIGKENFEVKLEIVLEHISGF